MYARGSTHAHAGHPRDERDVPGPVRYHAHRFHDLALRAVRLLPRTLPAQRLPARVLSSTSAAPAGGDVSCARDDRDRPGRREGRRAALTN